MPDQPASTQVTPQCPIRTTLDMLGGKWRLLIIQSLAGWNGSRYRDIKQRVPGISDKVLTDELRSMEESYLIERRVEGENRVLYSLTNLGEEARSLIKPMARFGEVYKKVRGL